jgi:outer membrane protein assembly factor BamB
MEKDGNKVFGKSFDRLLFQRATVFVAPSHLSNYTMQADVLTEGNARSKADIGLINQRYLICLRGNAGKLESAPTLERLKQEVVFKMTANKWYTLKTRVDVAADGSGVVKAKVWEKGSAEPEAWTIEAKVAKRTPTAPRHLRLHPAEPEAHVPRQPERHLQPVIVAPTSKLAFL